MGILLTLLAGYPLPMTFATVIRICADIARSMRSLRTNSSQSANAGARRLHAAAKAATPLLFTKNQQDPQDLLPNETSATRGAGPVAVKHGARGRE
jgi:hypothetical protein